MGESVKNHPVSVLHYQLCEKIVVHLEWKYSVSVSHGNLKGKIIKSVWSKFKVKVQRFLNIYSFVALLCSSSDNSVWGILALLLIRILNDTPHNGKTFLDVYLSGVETYLR